jgi:uncharacterized protein GlcG (DUF336 family)
MRPQIVRASLVVLAGASLSASAVAADLVSTQKLAWRLAAQLATEAVSVCEKQGFAVTAAVVESSGLEQALVKSDASHPQSVSIAYRKAYTAMAYGGLFGLNSTGELIASRPQLAAGPLNTVPSVLFAAGGVVIRAGQTVIGGLGVSGAPGGEKDEACAKTALESNADRLK